MAATRPSPTLMLLRGLFRRCPNCGGGTLFRGWLVMNERCPRCALKFEREEGFFLGAYVVNFGLVLILLGVYCVVGVIVTQPNPPIAALVGIGMIGSAVVAIGFYPMSKTFWSAIDLIMTPVRDGEARTPGERAATQAPAG
jgi:uncharacterized protein (DUF983 family)